MSASDDTIHCTQSEIVLSQRLYSVRTANLYNNEIVSIVEEYSIPGNVVTQPGEYMSRLVGLFHIMLMLSQFLE